MTVTGAIGMAPALAVAAQDNGGTSAAAVIAGNAPRRLRGMTGTSSPVSNSLQKRIPAGYPGLVVRRQGFEPRTR